MLTFKFKSIEETKPIIEEKSPVKPFIVMTCLSTILIAVFLHVVLNDYLQKQEYAILQLQKKIEKTRDKTPLPNLSLLLKNFSLKQVLFQKVLMLVTNNFSNEIIWQRIFMKKGKIFLVGEVSTIAALTNFLLQAKKLKLNFKLEYLKKSEVNFAFQFYLD